MMAEHFKRPPEQAPPLEAVKTPAARPDRQPRPEIPKAEEIRRRVEQHAISAKSIDLDETDNYRPDPKAQFVNSELRAMAYGRMMVRIRKQLPPPRRWFSQLVHFKPLDITAEAVARTVGRPSGFLGAGLLALGGSLAYYYVARRFGYDYQFFVFIFLMMAGFVGGWLTEWFWRLFRAAPK